MIVYFDENFPHQIPKALNLLQEQLNKKERTQIKIHSLIEFFERGTNDEDWIPKVGNQNAIIVTQDYNIQRTRHQRDFIRNTV